MTEAQSLDLGAEMPYYPWQWRHASVQVAYELRGSGPLVLLLPAYSSISTRAELQGLATGLALHYRVVTLDWVGFGESARPPWRSRPAIYQAMLKDFVRDVVPEVVGVVACGHSAGYALRLAALGEVPGGRSRRGRGALLQHFGVRICRAVCGGGLVTGTRPV